MFSTGLLLAFAGMCLCQQQSTSSSPSQYQSAAVSQTSFQTGSAVQQPQTKLEDIERDTLVAAFGQKTQQQSNKPSSVTPSVPQQQQQQQPPQSYQTVPQQQYFVQPYHGLQQQFFMQPYQAQPQQYLAQPYQMAFDYNGVQYSIVSPNSYPGNQFYQQFYVPAAQPSAVPQYVTKQFSSAAAPAQAQQEYKQQQFSAPAQAQQVYKPQQVATPVQVQQEYKQQFTAPVQAQQEYKQQQFNVLAQAQQEYKQQQQQYVVPSPAYQYVQQPAAPAANGPSDYSYVTRHPATTAAQFKAPTATAAVQPQFQYNALPQQYQQQQQQQQPQYYYTVAATEQPRVQQSAKSQFSSGVKSTTPTPLTKEQFAYKFESSPQQQQPGSAYSTLRYSA